MSRKGFSLVIAVGVLGGLVVMMAAFLTRVDSETRRVLQLQRGVYALLAANEALEKLRAKLVDTGQLPPGFEHAGADAQVTAHLAPSSSVAQSYYAFVNAVCQGAGIVVFATLRRQGTQAFIENKAVFYGSHKVEQQGVRDALLAKLKEDFKKLRAARDAERELERKGALAETYGAYFAETDLPAEAVEAVLE